MIIYYNEKGYSFVIACSPFKMFYDTRVENILMVPINIYRAFTPTSDVMALWKLCKLIRKEQFDMVIGHTPKGALLSMLASKYVGVGTRIYYRHGILYQTSKGLRRIFFKMIEILTSYCSTSIINVSRSVEEFSIQNKLNRPEKGIILGTDGSCGAFNPIKYSRQFIKKQDVDFFKNENQIKPNEILIGYFGRMVNDKGINDLINAWQILIEKYSNVKLVLAGEYEERDGLPKLTKDKIASNSTIIYLDYVKQLEVIYASLDIFILPSYREGLPTVILEASSMEVPVITTKVTGCVDAIVENETGIFCTHDPKNIAEKISFYIEHPEIRKLHGQNGRQFVLEHFNQSKIWEDFENKVLKL